MHWGLIERKGYLGLQIITTKLGATSKGGVSCKKESLIDDRVDNSAVINNNEYSLWTGSALCFLFPRPESLNTENKRDIVLCLLNWGEKGGGGY